MRIFEIFSSRIFVGDIIKKNHDQAFTGVYEVAHISADSWLCVKGSGGSYLLNGNKCTKMRWLTFRKECGIILDKLNDKLKWFTTNGNKT